LNRLLKHWVCSLWMELQLLQDNHTKVDQFPLSIQARLMQNESSPWGGGCGQFPRTNESLTKTFN